MIPLQRPFLGDDELASVAKVFDSRWLGLGPVGEAFEARLREFLGTPHVKAVNTGTSALHLALAAIDARPGDEVIVPSQTFVATIQAIEMARLEPVFCDIDEADMNLDVDDALRRVTPKTRGIIPVHFAGSVSPQFDRLVTEARSRGLRVIEDAAHAFGSAYGGRRVGAFADITCFSFDPIKNITCGEGGAVATGDHQVARRVMIMRNLGVDRDAWKRQGDAEDRPFTVTQRGWRYHLSDINASIGMVQLERLESFRARKLAICQQYDAAWRDMSAVTPLRRDPEAFPFMHIIRVLDGRRDELRAHLQNRGVATGLHYVPNHLQPHYARRRASLPVTERLFEQIVTLPLFYEMTDEQVETVIESVRSFFKLRNKARPSIEINIRKRAKGVMLSDASGGS